MNRLLAPMTNRVSGSNAFFFPQANRYSFHMAVYFILFFVFLWLVLRPRPAPFASGAIANGGGPK